MLKCRLKCAHEQSNHLKSKTDRHCWLLLLQSGSLQVYNQPTIQPASKPVSQCNIFGSLEQDLISLILLGYGWVSIISYLSYFLYAFFPKFIYSLIFKAFEMHLADINYLHSQSKTVNRISCYSHRRVDRSVRPLSHANNVRSKSVFFCCRQQ